jgi:hypothetical protein
MTIPLNPQPADLEEPPPPTGRVLTVGLVGVGLVLTAFVFGLATGAPRRGFDTHAWDGVRMLMSAVGLLLAGCAASMRPGWFGGWLCGAAAGVLGYGLGAPPPYGTAWYAVPPRDWFAAVPNSWDSVQLFFGVAGAVGLVGAVLTRLPQRAAYTLALCWMVYHFAGILSAVTNPPPTPWLSDVYWKGVAKPYLQFAYMNNAYQFYSPDPGPACELWVCVEYRRPGADDDPDAPKDCEWAFIPRRKHHYQDPLGLTYYRRLSLTENVAQYHPPGYVPLAAEQQQALARRQRAAQEEFVPRMGWSNEVERRVPNDLVTRHILPSFARHLAAEYARPGKDLKSIKIYRTLHMITTLPQFRGYQAGSAQPVNPTSPYNPALYLPYFQGEFTPDGKLVDSTEPLLYWLIPIMADPGRPAPLDRDEYRKSGGFSRYFQDSVSKHAGCPLPTEEYFP